MAFKLQHWLLHIVYIPGVEYTMADALSREERCHKVMLVDNPDIYLAEGDVEGQPPQQREEQHPQHAAGSTLEGNPEGEYQ